MLPKSAAEYAASNLVIVWPWSQVFPAADVRPVKQADTTYVIKSSLPHTPHSRKSSAPIWHSQQHLLTMAL